MCGGEMRLWESEERIGEENDGVSEERGIEVREGVKEEEIGEEKVG